MRKILPSSSRSKKMEQAADLHDQLSKLHEQLAEELRDLSTLQNLLTTQGDEIERLRSYVIKLQEENKHLLRNSSRSVDIETSLKHRLISTERDLNEALEVIESKNEHTEALDDENVELEEENNNLKAKLLEISEDNQRLKKLLEPERDSSEF